MRHLRDFAKIVKQIEALPDFTRYSVHYHRRPAPKAGFAFATIHRGKERLCSAFAPTEIEALREALARVDKELKGAGTSFTKD
jgi:hypothetical protein